MSVKRGWEGRRELGPVVGGGGCGEGEGREGGKCRRVREGCAVQFPRARDVI